MPPRRTVIFAGAGMALASAAAAAEDPPALVVLGTATPGGGFPVYGNAFAATIHEADPPLTVELRNTQGSTQNVPLLEAGQLDLGLVQGEPAYAALTGAGRPPTALKVVSAMYGSPGMFAVRADSPCRTIADLRGQAVALGAEGSGLTLFGRLVLLAAGLDPDRDIRPVYLRSAGEGPAMVGDGRVAALWGGGVGWPGFTALADAAPGACFIPPDEATIRRLLADHPGMRRQSVPAGTYRGQDVPIASVGSWSLVLARPDLDEAVAFRLARALDCGQAALARRLPQARETTPQNTVAAAEAAWLHPGVRRYLAEAGYLKT